MANALQILTPFQSRHVYPHNMTKHHAPVNQTFVCQYTFKPMLVCFLLGFTSHQHCECHIFTVGGRPQVALDIGGHLSRTTNLS
jgi:hypothetical protein